MIAFSVFGRPIYRYGIFYLITFVFGYFLLYFLGQKKYFKTYKNVQELLTERLDTFFIIAIVGVILGGRLGHVFLYERSYYAQNLGEILLINQGGMSFIGGVLGVTLGLFALFFSMKMKKEELFLLGDIVLCIVPVGIALGRIGNYLNQELRGRPIKELSSFRVSTFSGLGLVEVYENVDKQKRVNTNIIESVLEGFLPLLINQSILWKKYIIGKFKPGTISGIFLIVYAIARFFIEYFKDLPTNELWGILSVSQRIMILFFVAGSYLLLSTTK